MQRFAFGVHSQGGGCFRIRSELPENLGPELCFGLLIVSHGLVLEASMPALSRLLGIVIETVHFNDEQRHKPCAHVHHYTLVTFSTGETRLFGADASWAVRTASCRRTPAG